MNMESREKELETRFKIFLAEAKPEALNEEAIDFANHFGVSASEWGAAYAWYLLQSQLPTSGNPESAATEGMVEQLRKDLLREWLALEASLEDLLKFGQHKNGCEIYSARECSCGFKSSYERQRNVVHSLGTHGTKAMRVKDRTELRSRLNVPNGFAYDLEKISDESVAFIDRLEDYALQLAPSAPSSRGEVEEAVKAAIREAYANGVQEGETGESEKSVNEIIAALAKLGAR